MDELEIERIATEIARHANEEILRAVTSDQPGADADQAALKVAAAFAKRADALMLWRAAILRAQGESKAGIARTLGYASSGNINQRFPELDALSDAIHRALIREERLEIDVRGVSMVLDPVAGSGI